jgi:hypothetical protein
LGRHPGRTCRHSGNHHYHGHLPLPGAVAPNILVNNVGGEQTGAVMAVSTLAQNLGSSIGSQVTVTIVVAKSSGGDIGPGYTWAFAVAAAAARLAFRACSLVVDQARQSRYDHSLDIVSVSESD